MRMPDKKSIPAAGCLGLFFLLVMSACAPVHPKPSMDISAYETVPRQCLHNDFIIVRAGEADNFSSLAAKYLDDPSKDWLIAEFNRMERVYPGQELMIPLKPFRRGGLKTAGYQTVPVLVYHRFSEKKPDAMTVTESAFEEQMKFLKENDYRVITLDQLMDFIDFSSQIPEKSVVITLDDGWRSAYHIAFPILKKYGFTATLFVSTDFIGCKNALSWQQIRELAESGFDIQCHTKTHRNLAQSEKAESFEEYFRNLRREISIPRNVIKEKLGKTCRYIAYPYGETDAAVIAMLEKHGYRGAFTMRPAGNPFFVHPYRMHRFVIYGNGDFPQFKENLAVFRKWKSVLTGIDASPESCISSRNPDISLYEICRATALENERNGEFPLAFLYWKAAHDLHPGDPEIPLKISSVKAVAEKKAERHFKKGVAFHADDCFESARKEFLIALAYHPENEGAMDYLKNRLREHDSIFYTVTEGDTPERIASKIYKDPAKGFLVSYFTGIVPGTEPKPETVLRLPALDEKFSEKLLGREIEKATNSVAAYRIPKNDGPGPGGRISTDGFEETSEIRGSPDSGNESGHRVKPPKTDPRVSPGGPAADGNMDPPSDRNADLKMRAEEHYRTGIKFFIHDDLKMAIEEWKKTLSLNPSHRKAREDIKNAHDLLEKYKKHR